MINNFYIKNGLIMKGFDSKNTTVSKNQNRSHQFKSKTIPKPPKKKEQFSRVLFRIPTPPSHETRRPEIHRKRSWRIGVGRRLGSCHRIPAGAPPHWLSRRDREALEAWRARPAANQHWPLPRRCRRRSPPIWHHRRLRFARQLRSRFWCWYQCYNCHSGSSSLGSVANAVWS